MSGSLVIPSAPTVAEPIGGPVIRFPYGNLPAADKYAITIERRFPLVGSQRTPGPANRTSYAQLLTYTEALDNAAWTKIDTTVAATAYRDPNGRTGARRIVEAATTAYHHIQQVGTMAAGALTGIVALKAGERGYARVFMYNATDSIFASALVNLTTKTVTLESGTAAFAFDLRVDGWVAVLLQGTATVANSVFYVELANGSGARATYAGNTANGIYAYRPTLVLGTYSILPLIDTVGAVRTVSAPDLDICDPTAYLVWESPDPIKLLDGRVAVDRLYARIPADQYIDDSFEFRRPRMHNLKSGSSYAVSFDALTSYVFSSRKSVTLLAKPGTTYLNATNQQGTIGHQQVTVTLNTGSASFYLDDTDATIKDAMSTAWTGTTGSAASFFVSKGSYGIFISWAGISVSVRAITLPLTGELKIGDRCVPIGPSSGTGPIEIVGSQMVLTSTRTLSVTGHGGAAGNRVALFNNDLLVGLSEVVATVTDAFNIRTKDLPDSDAVVTHCAFNKDGTRYLNGLVEPAARRVLRHYLPGVSLGIATASDIPGQTPKRDAQSWLDEIVAGSAWTVVGTKGRKEYKGPILVHEATEIQMSQALITVAATP